MPQVIVLVIFYSRCGSTETLASSAAVGAVQARAAIRLRRMPDVSVERTLAADPDCRETLVRMHKEYVPPTEADLLAVDAVVLASPAGIDASSAEWAPLFAMLAKLKSAGTLAVKVGAVVEAGSEGTRASLSSALQQQGLAIPPPPGVAQPDPPARAKALGRSVAGLVRSLRDG